MASANFPERDGRLRVLLYAVQFEKNPLDAVDRVITYTIAKNGVSTVPDDYRRAIESALASEAPLAGLLPQPHPEPVVRAYLAEVGRRLRPP
jgi:hypothetical protein